MNTEQFAYWLQGYSEITNGRLPDADEWKIIQDHLKLVFDKKTPDRQVVSMPTIGYPQDTSKLSEYLRTMPQTGVQITC